MGDWRDALAAQHRLFRFYTSRAGLDYLNHTIGAQLAIRNQDGAEVSGERQKAARQDVYERLLDEIILGETVYVDAPLCALVAEAAATFPAQHTLGLEDLALQTGFAYFAAPLPLDQPGALAEDGMAWGDIRAISWVLGKSGVGLVGVSAGARPREPQAALIYSAYFEHPDTTPGRHGALCVHHSGGWYIGEDQPWGSRGMVRQMAQSGRELTTVPYDKVAPGRGGRKPMELSATYLLCLQLLMRQKVLVPERKRVENRGARKRLEREPLPDPARDTLVVRLRRAERPEGADQGPRSVDWSHQWLVRGHWHTYRVGPQRQGHKSRYVLPYVKGPEDKPLKVKKVIYKVDR